MIDVENFVLKWDLHETNRASSLADHWKNEAFVDATLVCDDDQIDAHKLVLSAASPLFQKALLRNQNHFGRPLIILQGTSKKEIKNLLEYIYSGEVEIHPKELESFMRLAESLQINGLVGAQSGDRVVADYKENVVEKEYNSRQATRRSRAKYEYKKVIVPVQNPTVKENTKRDKKEPDFTEEQEGRIMKLNKDSLDEETIESSLKKRKNLEFSFDEKGDSISKPTQMDKIGKSIDSSQVSSTAPLANNDVKRNAREMSKELVEVAVNQKPGALTYQDDFETSLRKRKNLEISFDSTPEVSNHSNTNEDELRAASNQQENNKSCRKRRNLVISSTDKSDRMENLPNAGNSTIEGEIMEDVLNEELEVEDNILDKDKDPLSDVGERQEVDVNDFNENGFKDNEDSNSIVSEGTADLDTDVNNEVTTDGSLEEYEKLVEELVVYPNNEDKKKKYSCRECTHTSGNKGHMKEHVEKHIEGFMFECTSCEKTFKRKVYLRMHASKCTS